MQALTENPVKMTSSRAWMTALGELGVEALMTKADLNSAYKVANINRERI